MAIQIGSTAFSDALSFSFMWTQEQCSRMLAISTRYLLSPACRAVSWNNGRCVLGVHEATIRG